MIREHAKKDKVMKITFRLKESLKRSVINNSNFIYTLLIIISLLSFQSCVEQSEEPVERVGKTAINPEHLSNTTQYGYSQAVSVGPNSQIVYIAGQIGISDNGPNDFETQVDRSFQNLKEVIEASGGRLENVVKITLLIKDHDDERLKYLVEKRKSFFGKNPPASTLIPVPILALSSLEFEIDAIVVLDKRKTH